MNPTDRHESRLSKSDEHALNVLKIETPVCVTVARKSISFSEVVNLAPGAILAFDKRCTEPLSIDLIGSESESHPVAQGTAVQIGDRLGIRLSEAADN